MLLKLRGIGESDRSKFEDQLKKDEEQSRANTKRLDFVMRELEKLEQRRATSSPHISSETVSLMSGRNTDMTIGDAIREYLQQKVTLECRARELHQNYDKHCEPLNKLNRRLRVSPQLITSEPSTTTAGETSPEPVRRLSPAWQ